MSKKPVPKKQQAKSASRHRSSKWTAEQRKRLKKMVVLDKCATTGETKRRHFASPSGNYKGRKVLETKADKKGNKVVAEIEA